MTATSEELHQSVGALPAREPLSRPQVVSCQGWDFVEVSFLDAPPGGAAASSR